MNSASISVLVNGSPTSEFNPQRGLRQGDPLAPFLFDLVAEGLTGLMREAISQNKFRSFLVGKDGLEVFDKFEAFHCLPDADTYYFTILLLHVFKGWGNGETCGDDEFKGKYGLQTTCVHLHCSC